MQLDSDRRSLRTNIQKLAWIVRQKRSRSVQAADLSGVLASLGAGEKSRTPDLRITNALLYQLSYTGVACLSQTFDALQRIDKAPILADGCDYFSANFGSFFATGVFFRVT
jgi:hypothetical protein